VITFNLSDKGQCARVNAGNPCVGLKAYVHPPVTSAADDVEQSFALPDSLTPGESSRYLLNRWFYEPQTRSVRSGE